MTNSKKCLRKIGPARPGKLSARPVFDTKIYGPARSGRAGPTGRPARADLWYKTTNIQIWLKLRYATSERKAHVFFPNLCC